jgi:hypothetical protein
VPSAGLKAKTQPGPAELTGLSHTSGPVMDALRCVVSIVIGGLKRKYSAIAFYANLKY